MNSGRCVSVVVSEGEIPHDGISGFKADAQWVKNADVKVGTGSIAA